VTTSPYVIGQWVRREKFYGRAALIEEILDGHRNSMWVLGTRRIGKTSLLKQIEHLASAAPERGWFPLFWDFQGAEDLGELHRGFGDALLDAEEGLERIGIGTAELEGGDLFESLGRLRRKLRGSRLRLLLLCDEVEELIKLHQKDPALLRKLRREMQSREDIRTVLTSTIRLWALSGQRGDTSPFLHGFTPPLHIHGLADGEARALIRQEHLPEDLRPAIDETSVEEIRARCDNHPYLMQLVGKKYQELKDLKEAIEQVASDQMVRYFFAVDYEMLSQVERDVLRIISEGSAASSDSILHGLAVDPGELGSTLNHLERLGYIRRDKEMRFHLVNDFFRRWFREQPRPDPPRPPVPRAGLRIEEMATQQPVTFDGRYSLLEEIGAGATGVVYKALDGEVGEMLAIKILKPEYCAHADGLERFRREILLSRDIGHPNVARIYHLGDCEGRKYLAMKLIEGMTLARLMQQGGPLPLSRAIAIARKLAGALEAAHTQHVIHRDVKPQNVLIDRQGEPYLTDFGLARLMSAPGMTHAGVFLGTPDYASPEQADLRPVDERSDIYALGVVLYEMVAGRRPFVSATIPEVLQMHRSSPPPDPRGLRPEVPALLAGLILRCLEKDPARRFASARALRLALEEITPP
jgi:serine/threonine protein kinase